MNQSPFLRVMKTFFYGSSAHDRQPVVVVLEMCVVSGDVVMYIDQMGKEGGWGIINVVGCKCF